MLTTHYMRHHITRTICVAVYNTHYMRHHITRTNRLAMYVLLRNQALAFICAEAPEAHEGRQSVGKGAAKLFTRRHTKRRMGPRTATE